MRPDATADRAGALVCLIGLLVAALSLVLAAIAGPPYLGLAGINGWMIVFAAALLAALIAIPFVLEARLRGVPLRQRCPLGPGDPGLGRDRPRRDGRRRRSIGASGDFAGDSLAGSAGLLAAGAGGLVLIAVATALLSG